MIECPRTLPMAFIKVQPGYDMPGSSFNAFSLYFGMIVQTNRLNPDFNENDFDDEIWTQLGGSQVIFQTIQSLANPIELQGLL